MDNTAEDHPVNVIVRPSLRLHAPVLTAITVCTFGVLYLAGAGPLVAVLCALLAAAAEPPITKTQSRIYNNQLSRLSIYIYIYGYYI